MSSYQEDLELVRGCLQNDRRSQKQLYKKHFKVMFQICLSYSGEHNEAKDIMQDAFVKVFTKMKDFNPNNSLEGWIRRIVINTAIDYFRQRKKIVFQDEFPDLPDEEESGHLFFQTLTNDIILQYVNRLPNGARIVFNLFAVEGMSHKEIANELNISEGTSKSQYKRARGLLKSWLYQYEIDRQ